MNAQDRKSRALQDSETALGLHLPDGQRVWGSGHGQGQWRLARETDSALDGRPAMGK